MIPFSVIIVLGAFLGGVQGFYSGWKHMGAIDQKASIKRTQYEILCFKITFWMKYTFTFNYMLININVCIYM